MTTSEERRATNDERVAADIKKFGCHVISVFDPEGNTPSFSYSVGIQACTGAAEAIVVGVRSSLGHSMVNAYNDQVRRGTQFKRGVLYEGFLEGFAIYVEPAKPTLLKEYTLGCNRYYKARPFSVVQLVYPSTTGVWPWQSGATEWFKVNQPMLGRKLPHRD